MGGVESGESAIWTTNKSITREGGENGYWGTSYSLTDIEISERKRWERPNGFLLGSPVISAFIFNS